MFELTFMDNLIFVYNANSGKLNTLLDVGHKLISPSTYSCRLCALTYDTFKENKIWKRFRSECDLEMEFYHIDEFEKKYQGLTFEYPVILNLNDNDLKIELNKTAIDAIKNVQDLVDILSKKCPTIL